MAEPEVHPHPPETGKTPEPKGKGTGLKKEIGGLPIWVWGLIVIGGVGAALLFLKWQKGQQSSTSNSNPNVDSQSVPITQPNTSGEDNDNDSIGSNQMFPPGALPPVPSGNSNSGGTVTTTDPGNPGLPVPVPQNHVPGTTFKGPSGVLHYVPLGNETLSQIAAKFGLKSWNDIYAIPDNQKLFGKMNAQQASKYKPASSRSITLPPNATVSTHIAGGGAERTYTVNNVLGGY